MDELLKTMEQAQSTGVMEYVRKLEGIIKHERGEREQRIREEVIYRVAMGRVKITLYGFVLGIIPYVVTVVMGYWK